jgi:tetrapyrrole methylase family protein/MazG family protein
MKNLDQAPDLFKKLCEVIAQLRNPRGGCPWDLEQTHSSLKQYMIEEAYETIDAIDNNPSKLSEELGDVLLQVMLHSQIGSDDGNFNICDVVETLTHKLIKRHPHVFSDTSVKGSAEVLQNWEKIKQKDLKPEQSVLDGVPSALPALLKAHRIGAKVGRIGFDWDTVEGVTDKVVEEMQEFVEASGRKNASRDEIQEEFGDFLFTLAQLARKLDFNSEDLLNGANSKFIRRFKAMEQKAGKPLSDLPRDELENLWAAVKSAEKK